MLILCWTRDVPAFDGVLSACGHNHDLPTGLGFHQLSTELGGGCHRDGEQLADLPTAPVAVGFAAKCEKSCPQPQKAKKTPCR